MKPKNVSIDIYNELIKLEPTTTLVDDSTIPYTPFVYFEKTLNDFATVTFRVHINKRHKYLNIENNAFIRIHAFDKLYSFLNDDYISEIGKIYFHSFSFFEQFIKQPLIANIEINDDNSEKVGLEIYNYINSFVSSYIKIFSFLELTFTEDFVRRTFNNCNGIAYANGDTFKLICPSITNEKLIELAGFNTYNKSNLSEALTILKGLTAKEIDEIARNSYNKLVNKICELNDFDYKLYESSESPVLSIQSKIKKTIYMLFTKYKKGFANR